MHSHAWHQLQLVCCGVHPSDNLKGPYPQWHELGSSHAYPPYILCANQDFRPCLILSRSFLMCICFLALLRSFQALLGLLKALLQGLSYLQCCAV